MNSAFILEICADSVESAINAQKGGADRVELCANMFEGGITPSYGTVVLARKYLDIELYVMIRPRGGDFCYSDLEFEQMKLDIELLKETGIDGLVFGILNPDGSIDTKRTKILTDLSRPLKVTFHRAFDMCFNPFQSLEDIIASGADRLLSSGLKQTALEGAELLNLLNLQANGRILIMPGAGINSENILVIQERTGTSEFHMTANSQYEGKMTYRKENIAMGGKLQFSEFSVNRTDIEKVKAICERKKR